MALNLQSPQSDITEQAVNSLERLKIRNNTIDASLPIKKTNLSLMLEEARQEIGELKSPKALPMTMLSPRGLISPNATSTLSPVKASPSPNSSLNRESMAANASDREA